jgi:hypothetical protein
MKKFLLIASIFTVLATVFTAQNAEAQTSFKSQYGNSLDTVTNAGTVYFTLTTQPASTNNIIEVQYKVTKISGTVGGTATLQSSLDGTNWYTVPGTSANTLTDGSHVTAFKVTNWGGKYLRIATTGTGTMAASLTASYNARKVFVDTRN